MVHSAQTRDAMARAIEFLRREQLPHGEFRTVLGADKNMSNAVFDSSPFVTSFVLYALAHVRGIVVDDIIAKAVAFLHSEMEFGGVWRYWSSRQHKHARLPPDLDDTSCISYALKITGEPIPNNLWAFHAARDPGGRFWTWLLPRRSNLLNPLFVAFRAIGYAQGRIRARRIGTPGTEDARFRIMQIDPNDIDPIVNANVLLYLGERAETQPTIDFLIETIRQGRVPFSLYYEEPLTLYYAVARACRHASPRLSILGENIAAKTLARCGEIGQLSALQAALAASVLLTFAGGSDALPSLITRILQSQRGDGGWEVYPFYNVWGSQELTTAFCVKVLASVGAHHTY
ncbi:MAG: terpene cyclase/mutase family protein [Methylobacteriaceae bacterium]|nr:terpene cyclase/mutase family protein [Methylobacteriaceae bacterium]